MKRPQFLLNDALSHGLVIGTLLVAVLLVPWPLASWVTGTTWHDPGSLAGAVADALARDWLSNAARPGAAGSALARPTGFWQAFHVVKATLAGGLLVVSARATARVWATSTLAGTRPARLGRLAFSTATLACGGLAVLLCVANLQGAIAPLTSVLGFLPNAHASDPGVAIALRDSLATGAPSATARVILTDFAQYHRVMAALGGISAAALIGATAVAWRRKRAVEGVMLALSIGFFAVVAVANLSTSFDPTPALAAFLAGIPTR